MTIDPFPLATIEDACKTIGDLYTGSELTRILADVGVGRYDPGEGNTKWKRLAQAVNDHQCATTKGDALVKLITVAMSPQRTLSRAQDAAEARDRLNQVLSLVGLKVTAEGKVARTPVAKTDQEALDRGERLKSLLVKRRCHASVLEHCRPHLAKNDYYEVVFEAVKGLGGRLSEMAGVDEDGYKAVEAALTRPSPKVRLNALVTATDRNEQVGIANLCKGLFSAFRNPAAHETRLSWMMTEQDALDVLGALSLIHRRLDAATTAPKAG
jgi:uncharacterized protein (TIGR02391 family)